MLKPFGRHTPDGLFISGEDLLLEIAAVDAEFLPGAAA